VTTTTNSDAINAIGDAYEAFTSRLRAIRQMPFNEVAATRYMNENRRKVKLGVLMRGTVAAGLGVTIEQVVRSRLDCSRLFPVFGGLGTEPCDIDDNAAIVGIVAKSLATDELFAVSP
jgi:hypothetical protein